MGFAVIAGQVMIATIVFVALSYSHITLIADATMYADASKTKSEISRDVLHADLVILNVSRDSSFGTVMIDVLNNGSTSFSLSHIDIYRNEQRYARNQSLISIDLLNDTGNIHWVDAKDLFRISQDSFNDQGTHMYTITAPYGARANATLVI